MIVFKSMLILFIFPFLFSCMGTINKVEYSFQNDADLIRLEHLLYWSGLFEDYYKIYNKYPLQNKLVKKDENILVKISTEFQREYSTVGKSNYNPMYDVNASNYFTEISVKELIDTLERGLGKTIDEKYDIQKVPTKSPIGYNYFVCEDGYLLWVTCITCGVTKISTLLMDGFTPTVNIASEGMKKNVFKSLTRNEMIANPQFKEWRRKIYNKEGFVRKIEEENKNDSKRIK